VLILEEIGQIGVVEFLNGEVGITVTKEEFHHLWKNVWKGTQFAMPGIHYGHYKAVAHSEKV